MTLKRNLVEGEYYHVYNRGARQQTLFKDSSDWARFVFSLVYYQSPVPIPHSERYATLEHISEGFLVPIELRDKVVTERSVEVVAFCVMPNHFHAIVREKTEGGIARYMQRVLVSYTMYSNAKYETIGHAFQGRFRAKPITGDEYLMHLSAYIHRNPRELKAWRGKEEKYPYSSLQDYVDKNRWGNMISTEIIAGRFASTPESNYRDFVRTSPAKLLEKELADIL